MKSLKDFQDAGGFRSGKPIAKEIRFKLDDGAEHVATIHVKRLSVGETERAFIDAVGGDLSRAAKIISECVTLGEKGEERIQLQQADKLHPRLAAAMIAAITEVNGKKAKN